VSSFVTRALSASVFGDVRTDRQIRRSAEHFRNELPHDGSQGQRIDLADGL